MRVNAARVLEDSDYEKVRSLCESSSSWTEVYNKKGVVVSTQSVPNSTLLMIKACALLSDVSANVAFDVLMDGSYRLKWDRHLAKSVDIGLINPNNDIGYYALCAIPPVRARDFVMQRSWLDMGSSKIICSHSVCHSDYPPQKGYVRGTVVVSGYHIKQVGDGCAITYISHADPRGKLPPWLINRLTRIVAPKVIKKLHKAALAYPEWKRNNNPNFKPWSFPEQQVNMARVDLSKCEAREYESEVIDESLLASAANGKDDEDD